MIDPKRRELFVDLYRIAEHYENPPFKPGDIDGNANWFIQAQKSVLDPFLEKYPDRLAADLVFSIVDEAGRKARKANEEAVTP